MSQTEDTKDYEKSLRVRRGRVDSVDLFEVKESELEILENGEPVGIYLNFSIFLISLSFSGVLTLATATFSSVLVMNSFLFVTILGIIIGGLLLILWWRGRKSIKSVIKIIKNRIPPDLTEQVDLNIKTKSSSKHISDTAPEG